MLYEMVVHDSVTGEGVFDILYLPLLKGKLLSHICRVKNKTRWKQKLGAASFSFAEVEKEISRALVRHFCCALEVL